MKSCLKNFIATSSPKALAVLAVLAALIAPPSDSLAVTPSKTVKGEDSPHILKVGTYSLNTRNVKTLKAQGPYLWVGTTLGAIRYDIRTEEDYEIFDNKNALLSNGIFAFAFDRENRPWVGTYGGGLSRFDGKNWINLNTPQGLADAFVFDILFAGDTAWIATWSGINRIKSDGHSRADWQTYTVENTGKGLIDNWVYAIETDAKGRLWFGTESGLSMFDGKTWRSWNHDAGLGAPYSAVAGDNQGVTALFQGAHHTTHYPEQSGASPNYRPNYILCMLMDRNDNLWIGTWGGGLSIFDPKSGSFRNFTAQDGLSGNYILSLGEDAAGHLWIGTNNGLNRFDGTTFTRYGKTNGLTSDFIFSLEFAGDGSLWLGGHYGLNRLKIDPGSWFPERLE